MSPPAVGLRAGAPALPLRSRASPRRGDRAPARPGTRRRVAGVRLLEAGLLGVALVLAVAALASHALDRDLLGLFPGPTPITGNVALALLALSGAVALGDRRGVRILGGLAALLGAMTLTQYALSLDLGIDQLLIDEFAEGTVAHPGRMAPSTAFALVMLGLAAVVRARWTLVPAGVTFVVALGGVVGHTDSRAEVLARIGGDVVMSLPAGVALACASLALVLAREREYFTRTSVGGTLVRRMAPAVILLPMLGGSLLLAGTTQGLVSEAAGIWMLCLVGIGVGLPAVFAIARILDRQERHGAAELSLHAETTAALSEGMCLRYADTGEVISVNPALESIFGYDAQQILGTQTLLLTEPNERLMRSALTADGEWSAAAETVRADGTLFWCSVKASAFEHPELGQLRVALYHDITDRRLAEHQRRSAESERELALVELRRSNRELEQFAHVASHDLSEPLRVIGGFVSLLRRRYEGRLDDDADRFIDATVSGVDRMQSMVDALLSYSRLGSGEMERSPVDTSVPVGAAVATLAGQAEQASAEVRVGPLPVVSADAGLLERVFQNLISNALKFSDGRAPVVEISAKHGDGEWTFSVADNGLGIDPEHAERVFAMFQRLHGRDTPGTGIGLAVVRRIVERHGGRIWVSPAPGGGSIFSFTVTEVQT